MFDLDNTLYDSSQYLLGAFKLISEHVSRRRDIGRSEVYAALVGVWKDKTSIYPKIFEDALEPLGLNVDVKKLASLFNAYSGRIMPYPDTISTLNRLKERSVKLALVTDGNVPRQTRKLKLLKIQRFFDAIVFTDEMAAKPSPFPFLEALRQVDEKPSNSIYVADNPVLDFRGPKIIGMGTARILRGEFCRFPKYEDIDFEVKSLDEIVTAVRSYRRSEERSR
jgi:putative hydrolase of the HAD superfamily